MKLFDSIMGGDGEAVVVDLDDVFYSYGMEGHF